MHDVWAPRHVRGGCSLCTSDGVLECGAASLADVQEVQLSKAGVPRLGKSVLLRDASHDGSGVVVQQLSVTRIPSHRPRFQQAVAKR